jgi:hypothetical protein
MNGDCDDAKGSRHGSKLEFTETFSDFSGMISILNDPSQQNGNNQHNRADQINRKVRQIEDFQVRAVRLTLQKKSLYGQSN